MTDLQRLDPVTQASERLFAAAQRVLPGGVNSPVRAFRSVGGTPASSRGARARGSRTSTATATSTWCCRGGR